MIPRRRLLTILLAGAAAASVDRASAAPPQAYDLFSDTWVATDALGRDLPIAEAPAARADRFVGIFYFLWHGGHGTAGPYDNSVLIAQNPRTPAFGPPSSFHWWGEPESGYFRAIDPWVIRRNLSMLQDAGVDVLFIDVTNAFTYPGEVRALCDVASAMRAEGNLTPQIAFLTHSRMAETINRLWDEIYFPNLYPDLWFRWQGKPMLLGRRDATTAGGQPLSPEIQRFFTWRESWAWDPGRNKWQWIDTYPQRWGWDQDPAIPEELPVAVASHPTNNRGRSFQGGREPPIDQYALTQTYGAGLHFAEQWARVLEVDPQMAFITGWNEWVAQRFVINPGQQVDFLGRRLSPGETFFVDNYNAEFNRDIEPMKGGSGDNLYYQMIANIRLFKGIRPAPAASDRKTIHIDGRFGEWDDVLPEYRDTIGDTIHRDANGWGSLHYTDLTGRNDIVAAKVAVDETNVYFYARTRDALTPSSDPAWMMLLIDADQNPDTGWHGYDFLLNGTTPGADTTTVLVHDGGGWSWRPVGQATYFASGNQLEIGFPRDFIGQGQQSSVTFDFHWADNVPLGAEIDQFFVHGDNAPNRRFNYRYESLPVTAARLLRTLE